MSDNTKLIEAIKNAENAIAKAINTLKEISASVDANKKSRWDGAKITQCAKHDSVIHIKDADGNITHWTRYK